MNQSDVAIFVTADAVFPVPPPMSQQRGRALTELSRDDTLFTCARFNAIVSGFGPDLSNHQRQDR
jgi:hypothetical protein